MSNIYMYNALTSSKLADSENTHLYTLTRLLNFRNDVLINSITDDEFAAKLLSVVKNNDNLNKVSRLCIAFDLPASNKIKVLSAGTSSEENLMPSGYSCFTSSTSSLRDIGQGKVRTFSDIEDIISSYEDEGKPVQRSLQYLYEMGIKSGMCIHLSSGLYKGYLFLNSDEVGYFDDIIRDNATYLNLLEMIANDFFSKKITKSMSPFQFEDLIDNIPKDLLLSNIHLTSESTNFLDTVLKKMIEGNVEINISDETNIKTLIPWGQILIVITSLYNFNLINNSVLKISLYEEDNHLLISLQTDFDLNNTHKHTYNIFRSLKRFCSELGIDIAALKNRFVIKVEVDDIKENHDLEYSVK